MITNKGYKNKINLTTTGYIFIIDALNTNNIGIKMKLFFLVEHFLLNINDIKAKIINNPIKAVIIL